MSGDERPPRVCDACLGDGGWDVVEASPGTLDGAISYYVPCTACDETGEVEDDSVPVTMEDLEEMVEAERATPEPLS